MNFLEYIFNVLAILSIIDIIICYYQIYKSRILITVNATSWMLVVYGIKEKITILRIPQCFFGVVLLSIPIILSWISVRISVYFLEKSLKKCEFFREFCDDMWLWSDR